MPVANPQPRSTRPPRQSACTGRTFVAVFGPDETGLRSPARAEPRHHLSAAVGVRPARRLWPAGIGYSCLDWFGAYNMATAALAALYRRATTGRGCNVDASQAEVGIFLRGTSVRMRVHGGDATSSRVSHEQLRDGALRYATTCHCFHSASATNPNAARTKCALGQCLEILEKNGGPGDIRTHDLCLRRGRCH
jgi:hypothetical protein